MITTSIIEQLRKAQFATNYRTAKECSFYINYKTTEEGSIYT